MSIDARFLTFDLGAESGRAVLGTFRDGKMTLDETHRFLNEPQWILGNFYWDILRLFAEIKHGLSRTIRDHGPTIDGLGVDTWGVDFGLLDANDELLGMPRHYRDHRTDGIMEEAFAIVPKDQLYKTTGIQLMQFNTIFQLFAMRKTDFSLLDQARSLLTTPDLLNFWLTGRKVNEFTITTTTQCYDPMKEDWARDLMERLGLPTHFLGEIVPPGTKLDTLHESVKMETGAHSIPVIAPACHDTGSAVAAVPADTKSGWAYVSCGTWSLVGVEVPAPIINQQTLEFNLTNEGGVNKTYRLLRNVMGLWLLQRCKRSWEKSGYVYDYSELAAMGERAPAFSAIVDPDDPAFLNPSDMPTAIAEYCSRTGQTAPADVASMVRCILESLALKYRWVIEMLEKVTGEPIHTIHIIGGGSRNQSLCQYAANATGKRVLAGPVEATAAGNILVQAMACGVFPSLEEGRKVVRKSFPLVEYSPRDSEEWEEPYRKMMRLLQ
jgi:rhamnulokinase